MQADWWPVYTIMKGIESRKSREQDGGGGLNARLMRRSASRGRSAPDRPQRSLRPRSDPTDARAKQFKIDEAERAKLFWDGVNVDYPAMQATGAKLKKILEQGKEIHVSHSNGTDLTASLEKRPVFVSDGVIGDDKIKQG